MADEAPGYVVYVQGGESTITEGPDGEMTITVQDVIPFVHIANEEKNRLNPVEILSGYTYPLDAALVFSGSDGESAFLVTISNLSLSNDDTILMLQVTPEEFYEGELLNSFVRETKGSDLLTQSGTISTGIYIEKNAGKAENSRCSGDDIISYQICYGCCDGQVLSYSDNECICLCEENECVQTV